jgi:hypothetical protein
METPTVPGEYEEWRPGPIPGRREAAESIRAAFADIPHPGGEPFAEWLRGKTWREIASVDRVEGDLLFLIAIDAPAFRYYLPAFLLASLEDSAGPPETDITETLIGFLAPGGNVSSESDFHERMDGLTPEQVEALCRYLEYQSAFQQDFNAHLKAWGDDDPLEDVARTALDRYWNDRRGARVG